MEIGIPFIELLQVDSTNNYAYDLIKNNMATSGMAIFAHHQTNGKGQMLKHWQSNEGENIVLSVIINISQLKLSNRFYLVATAALACCHFFKHKTNRNTAIKWMNDIYFNDNKAGGILIETTQHNNEQYAIVGIGINVNQVEFDKKLSKVTSLKLITDVNYDVIQLSKELCNYLSKWFATLFKEKYKDLVTEYNKFLYKKNELVTLKKGNIKFTCVIQQVNDYGELEVENGLQEKFGFGEVSWVM